MSDDWEELANKPMPRFEKEEPIVGRWWLLEEEQQPETEMQALMEAPPGGHIKESKEEQQTTIHAVYDIVENDLTEEERAVIETTVFAGHSIRDAAKILGWPKSTVHRLKTSALNQIQRKLENE